MLRLPSYFSDIYDKQPCASIWSFEFSPPDVLFDRVGIYISAICTGRQNGAKLMRRCSNTYLCFLIITMGKNRASNESSSEQHFGCVDINNDRCDNIDNATDLDRVTRFAKKTVQTSISYKGSLSISKLQSHLTAISNNKRNRWIHYGPKCTSKRRFLEVKPSKYKQPTCVKQDLRREHDLRCSLLSTTTPRIEELAKVAQSQESHE